MDYPQLSTPLLQKRAPLSNQATPSPVGIYTVLGWSAAGPLIPHTCLSPKTKPRHNLRSTAWLRLTANTADQHQEEQSDQGLPPGTDQDCSTSYLRNNHDPTVYYSTPTTERPCYICIKKLKCYQMDTTSPQCCGRVPQGPPTTTCCIGRMEPQPHQTQRSRPASGIRQDHHTLVRVGIRGKAPRPSSTRQKAFYLPYFAVLRPEKASSPVRIVMNGKAVFGPDKISLNDCVRTRTQTHQRPS